jgi:hypothetical protein
MKKQYLRQYLRIDLDISTHCIRDIDPEDNWDAGDWEATLHQVRASLRDSTGTYYEEALPNVGDTIYVLIERVHTGSTFGYTTGEALEKGWFRTREEAEAQQTYDAETDGYFDHHEGWEIHEVTVD